MRALCLLIALLLSLPAAARNDAILVVVDSRSDPALPQISSRLSELMRQTGNPLAKPVLYRFDEPRQRRYCEQSLGIQPQHLPLVGLVQLDRAGRVMAMNSSFANIDRDPSQLVAAVEQWSGERVTVRSGVAPAPRAIPNTGVGRPPGGLEIERVRAQRGGPPFHVLNIRVTLKNGGEQGLEGLSLELQVREASSNQWRLLKAWPALPRLQPGYRMSRDFIGKSDLINSADFRVRVLVTSPQGAVEKVVGPAGEDESW